MRVDYRRELPAWPVCRGNLKQVLTEIVVNECKSRFIIRTTGQIYITKADDGIDNGLTLTPANDCFGPMRRRCRFRWRQT